MKYILFFLTIFFSIQSCKAQDVTIMSKQLYNIKSDLESYPDSLALQKIFLDNFPDSAVKFEELFYNKESLLYGKEISYSMVLMNLIKNDPDFIGQKLLSICTNFSKNYLNNYDLGGLRYPTLKYILSYSESFILHFNKMQYSEQQKLIKYLADVENHDTYRYYQEIIDEYTLLNYEVAQSFEKYRLLRQKQKH